MKSDVPRLPWNPLSIARRRACFTLLFSCLLGAAGCDSQSADPSRSALTASTSETAPTTPTAPTAPTAPGKSATGSRGERATPARATAAIRARAEAAHAELDHNVGPATGQESSFTRSEAQLGIQEWPTDLPHSWPQPETARLLADMRRSPGDRLLLIDLPDPPANALAHYSAALRANGYIVAQPDTQRALYALHALSDEAEAVLRFLPLENSTRLEILFIEAL